MVSQLPNKIFYRIWSNFRVYDLTVVTRTVERMFSVLNSLYEFYLTIRFHYWLFLLMLPSCINSGGKYKRCFFFFKRNFHFKNASDLNRKFLVIFLLNYDFSSSHQCYIYNHLEEILLQAWDWLGFQIWFFSVFPFGNDGVFKPTLWLVGWENFTEIHLVVELYL